jgi:hypothetical protein
MLREEYLKDIRGMMTEWKSDRNLEISIREE